MKGEVIVAGLGALLFASACGGNVANVARMRAVHDLSCPQEQITVTNIGGTTYKAKGCQKQATYMCSGSNFMHEGTCMKEAS